MKTLTPALVVLLLTGSASAQSVPSALLNAKTVAVVNDGVDQGVYDDLVTAVRDWNRLTVVESPTPADVTLAISEQKTVGSTVTGRVVSATTYRLTFKSGETVLYSDSAKGCCTKKSMMRKTLEKLDKRMP